MFVFRPQNPVLLAMNGFSSLLFAPPAPKILAEINTTILYCFLPRLPIKAFTQCRLTYGL